MARPKPVTVLRHLDLDGVETNVAYADGMWVVCYKGTPISVRKGPENNAYPGFKYLKAAWPHPGHAFNMADKLNALFQTQDFAVWQMKPYKEIVEPVPLPRPPERTWTPTKFTADDIATLKGQKPKRLL